MKKNSKKIFSIRVITRASKPGVTLLGEKELQVKVHKPPYNNEANEEVIELLAEFFSVPKSCVQIMRGANSRKKLISIQPME